MIASPFELRELDDANPLDLVEDLAVGKNWRFMRHDDDLISLFVKGQKTEYEIGLEWQDEFSAVLFGCSLPTQIGEAQYEIAARTMEQINQNIWLGHFDLSNNNRFPTFRYTLLCRMFPAGASVEVIADVIDVLVAECNRFLTIFQLAAAGDVRLRDNLHAAIYETIGEA